jgi:para-aminobenzoate synthetase component 1
MIQNNSFFNKLNELGQKGLPFLFIIDFEGRNPEVFTLDGIPNDIFFDISGEGNTHREKSTLNERFIFRKYPVSFEEYQDKFNRVLNHLRKGDTYLINLTQPTRVDTDLSLKEIFTIAKAPYKLYFRDLFTVFSPESFVRISNNKIMTFPMKGTIDGNIPDAGAILLNDPKELSEHNTIVDLMRNDLSMVAKKVKVERFRYIERITTNEKSILQASSEISGELPPDYPGRIGEILKSLLPAGSVSGAPKPKTVDILHEVEGYDRSYYTGIFGVFDGKNLDSAVMIRYIEKDDEGFLFKSGGGITSQSDVRKEYQEMIDKVYVPIA